MPVPKSRRGKSQFEVFHNYNKMKDKIAELVLLDFGYKRDKHESQINHKFFRKTYEEMSDCEKEQYERKLKQMDGFTNWFITYEREVIMKSLSNAGLYIYMANSIYPTNYKEYTERRVCQDKAIGLLMYITEELRFIIRVIPTTASDYMSFIELVNTEISLIRGWRQSDNKRFKNLKDEDSGNSLLSDIGKTLKNIEKFLLSFS